MNPQEILEELLTCAETLKKFDLEGVHGSLVDEIIDGLKKLMETHELQICLRCGYEMRGIPENFNQGICPHNFVPEKELKIFAA